MPSKPTIFDDSMEDTKLSSQQEQERIQQEYLREQIKKIAQQDAESLSNIRSQTVSFDDSKNVAVVAQRRAEKNPLPAPGTRNDQIAAEHLAKLKRMLGPVPK
jgi:hypothetical protein